MRSCTWALAGLALLALVIGYATADKCANCGLGEEGGEPCACDDLEHKVPKRQSYYGLQGNSLADFSAYGSESDT